MPLNGFTTVDIGCERGNNSYNMVNSLETPFAAQYLQVFDSLWNDKEKLQDVTDVVLENITTAYNENSPELIYFITLYNVFSEFLEDVSEDVLPNEATGFKNSKIWDMLYDFQKDAALAIINKLEKYNGCILADSVGLGKTFTAVKRQIISGGNGVLFSTIFPLNGILFSVMAQSWRNKRHAIRRLIP